MHNLCTRCAHDKPHHESQDLALIQGAINHSKIYFDHEKLVAYQSSEPGLKNRSFQPFQIAQPPAAVASISLEPFRPERLFEVRFRLRFDRCQLLAQ